MTVDITTYGKINLSLRSGPVDDHGYHPLRTIFASVGMPERVRVRAADEFSLSITGAPAGSVPLDDSNLAARAARLLAERVGRRADVAITIDKTVPVGGGMGGGSADAAGTLLALNDLWEMGLHKRQLAAISRPLGADVPFAVIGGVALGTGRGDSVQPVACARELHFALGFQDEGISTAEAYRAFDAHRPSELSVTAEEALLAALAAGDVATIGAQMHNDLQAVALEILPKLQAVLDAATGAGALGAIVTGSGPTVAALARDAVHAGAIAAAWEASGVCPRAAAVTSVGARAASVAAR